MYGQSSHNGITVTEREFGNAGLSFRMFQQVCELCSGFILLSEADHHLR